MLGAIAPRVRSSLGDSGRFEPERDGRLTAFGAATRRVRICRGRSLLASARRDSPGQIRTAVMGSLPATAAQSPS